MSHSIIINCRQIALVIVIFVVCSNTLSAQLIDIFQGKKKVEIPFSYYHNFIVIDTYLFGLLPMQFIYDTGAEHIILFKRHYTDIMNVDYDRRIPIMGADMSTALYALVARNINLKINGLPLIEKDILVLEDDYFKLEQVTGTQIDGIIGSEFFKNKIVNINYQKQKLVIHDPKYFKPLNNSFQELNIQMKANKPYYYTNVTLQNGATYSLQFLLDTGSGIPLLIHNNTAEGLGLPKNFIQGTLGVGLGGPIKGYLGRVENLDIGDEHIRQVLTNFQDVSERVTLDDNKFRNGIIGNEILSRFNVYFDPLKEKAYFKPNRKFNKKFKMDKSGLVIFATGKNLNHFVVQDIIPNSPASYTDIRKGDLIKQINRIPTKYLTLNGLIRKLQRKTGKRIRLKIVRKDKLILKEFKLRELI